MLIDSIRNTFLQGVLTFCNKIVYINLHKLLIEGIEMNTVSNEGLLNNYAAEPAVYYAEYPSTEQQRRYAFQGAIATLFLTSIILLALSVS
jgi:hypothetical protein